MRIFLDTADVNEVRKRVDTGLISGITTNPTLILRSGRKPRDVYQELNDLDYITDVSMEVTADSALQMYNMGIELSDTFEHATIKLPCTVEGLKACHMLNDEKVRTNVTLIFSPAQAILASLAGARYISPFVGRLDDNSIDGLQLIKDIHELYLPCCQILAASIRDPKSVSKAFGNGADICTLPPAVFDKMYKHVLTDQGLAQFNKDDAETQAKASDVPRYPQ
jgi:transaldolase